MEEVMYLIKNKQHKYFQECSSETYRKKKSSNKFITRKVVVKDFTNGKTSSGAVGCVLEEIL